MEHASAPGGAGAPAGAAWGYLSGLTAGVGVAVTMGLGVLATHFSRSGVVVVSTGVAWVLLALGGLARRGAKTPGRPGW
jgi:hypothetical protein